MPLAPLECNAAADAPKHPCEIGNSQRLKLPKLLWLTPVSKPSRRRVARPMASGPLLSLGNGVVVDCRFLDRVELAGRPADAAPLRLLLSVGEMEVGVEYPGSPRDAEALIVNLAGYTRAAPIRSDEQYEQDAALLHAVVTGAYEQPPVLAIEGDVVCVEGGLLSTGMVGYVIDEVEEAAARGSDVELISGTKVPAAILLLAIAAASPPSLKHLEGRLNEYRQTCRRPSVLS